MSLRSRLILRFFLAMPVLAAAFFIPAGTWRYWQGWMVLATFGAVFVAAVGYFYQHDREALERRLRSKEQVIEQKRVVKLLKAVYFGAILIPGFDQRLGWSREVIGAMPPWLSVLSEVFVVLGSALIFWVIKVNSFAGRTIEVEAGQKVISSGPYARVRHPMYSGMALFLLFMPLALGSYVASPVFALTIPIFVFRLLNEERFLQRELPGYSGYCLRTRFRLVPHVW